MLKMIYAEKEDKGKTPKIYLPHLSKKNFS